MMAKQRLELEVGKYYNLYDGWTSWKSQAKYLGNKEGKYLFVFGEKEKKGYALLNNSIAQKEEIITHSPVAAHGFFILSKEEMKSGDSKLLNILKQLGEKI